MIHGVPFAITADGHKNRGEQALRRLFASAFPPPLARGWAGGHLARHDNPANGVDDASKDVL